MADLWDRMSNMRLALWLLLLLALGGVVGVIVGDQYPTDRPDWMQLAERKAGPALFQVLKFFQMFDPFRSWWFRGLVTVLAISLLACSIKRGRGAWRRALFASWLDQPRFYERYDHRATFETSAADPFAPIVALVRRTLYRVQRRPGPDGTLLLACDRGGPARFGPFLSHVGLLLLLIGGLVGTVFGLKTMLWLAPGERTDFVMVGPQQQERHPLPFELAVDDFTVDLNEQGMVRQYLSDVTVTPRGGAPFRQTIAVNHPLRLAGYNFYQASYQPAVDQVGAMIVAVLDTAGQETAPPVSLRYGERLSLGDGLEAEAIRFLPDARVGPSGLQNASHEHRNPAFLFRVLRDGVEIGQQWSFVAFPAMRIGSWTERALAVRDYDPAYATGLEVTRAPLVGLIWAGLLLSTIGLLLSFNVAHRQLWALAEPDGRGGWRVHVAAFTNRAPLLFDNDFRRWAEGWAKDPAVRDVRVHARADAAKEKRS